MIIEFLTTVARISRYGTINPIDMNKTESAKFTVSVKAAAKNRLEILAKIAGRSSSFLAAEAISEYLDVNETQVSGISCRHPRNGRCAARSCAPRPCRVVPANDRNIETVWWRRRWYRRHWRRWHRW
jgi:hypothetical protein